MEEGEAKIQDSDPTESKPDQSESPAVSTEASIHASLPPQEDKEAVSEDDKKMRQKQMEFLSSAFKDGKIDQKFLKDKIERAQFLFKKREFWDSQPVPKIWEGTEEIKMGPIEENKPKTEIKQTPYPLPDDFVWSDLDLKDNDQAEELYKLLTKNYVEDEEGNFRFDYSIPFLRWTLLVPNYKPSWHVGVRLKKNTKLVGFISGIPLKLIIDGKAVKVCEINFLCVFNKLRKYRLAPVLIKEVTRRVNLKGIFQAVYTAGVELPKPISKTRYYHRSLNPTKLIEIGFSSLPMDATVSKQVKRFKLPSELRHKNLRPMVKKDASKVHKLLTEYFERKKFRIYTQYSHQEVAHLFTPIEGVIDTYVLDDPDDPKKISDMISFYHLPSSVLKNKKHDRLNAAYSFYTVATKVELPSLVKDGLVLAKKQGFDVFNALNIMDNEEVFQELKFGMGDGNLHYYLYNWMVSPMEPKDIAIVLV